MTLAGIRVFFLMVPLLWMAQSNASVVITGTRVIYPLSSTSVTVRLLNDGSQPSLVQAWADDGAGNTTPNESKAPFLVTPPVFRMEPQAGQTLRLALTDAGLPKDRESVFWLNVLDIPPKPSENTGNYLQMAVRTRIKIFARPEDLGQTVSEAAGKLKWTTSSRGELVIHNPGPYYFSLNGISTSPKTATTPTQISAMVPPFSSTNLRIRVSLLADAMLDITYINDYGGTTRTTISGRKR
ncbi:putative fimbrial chaperone protein [Advenella kashmirensis WT001]|uniref:Putative fimbrial chaperone protein n=1 Tax=Advenella kashmirensis (strain DSM 17095 / LMG 22695 / WT001) TaxID=1036672 RepID=I3UAF2_ADVKW|nr:molecular chaperone [Advenella kashmirensis]AFK61990.1 putative fimbrial chaperone protein [Advenella kashmirensis WT001]